MAETSRRGFLGGLAATLLVSTTGVKLAVPKTEPLLAANGWPICNGQTLLRSEYPELFKVIGTLYGGDDEQFGLPQFASLPKDAFGQMVVAIAPRSMPPAQSGYVQMMFIGDSIEPKIA